MKEALYYQKIGRFSTRDKESHLHTISSAKQKYNLSPTIKKVPILTSDLVSDTQASFKKTNFEIDMEGTVESPHGDKKEDGTTETHFVESGERIRIPIRATQSKNPFHLSAKSIRAAQMERRTHRVLPEEGKSIVPQKSTIHDFNSALPRPEVFKSKIITQADYNIRRDFSQFDPLSDNEEIPQPSCHFRSSPKRKGKSNLDRYEKDAQGVISRIKQLKKKKIEDQKC